MATFPPRKPIKTILWQRSVLMSGKARYVALGGAGLLGVFTLSLLASWLLKAPLSAEVVSAEAAISQVAPAPATPTVQPILMSEVTAQPSELSAYSQVMAAAATKAESAQNITQSAFSPSDWEIVTTRWKEAIYLIEQIPASDALYNEAQEKKKIYRLALSYAHQGQPVPDDAATFSDAIKTATEAFQLTQQARTAEEWSKVAEKWGEASILMGKVPEFAENHQLAQEKVNEYVSNQNYAQAQANRPVTGGSSVYTTNSSSGSSGSGSCDYPWQYDSAGRLCGDRAASVKPGGRLGGTGSSSSSSTSSGSNCHYVSGYTRKNGTYVSGHTRCR